MHQVLIDIKTKLEEIVTQVRSSIPSEEPFSNAHNNWTFPGLTRADLIDEAQAAINLINEQGGDDVNSHEARLQDFLRRLELLRTQTIPNIWANPAAGVTPYLFTLHGLRQALALVLVKDDIAEAAAKLKKITMQLRALESRLNGLEPRTNTLASMVGGIEQAYSAADQLSIDLETLSESRREITDLVAGAVKDKASIAAILEQAISIDRLLITSSTEAKSVLDRCETAYAASTSIGLSAAFSERSEGLSKSMWIWVIGLLGALFMGGHFGTEQLKTFSELLKTPGVPTLIIGFNFFLSIVSIGGPVWFAWLATKQIGQRFRLAEDYAFKASISRAYEGFRREAARFDKDMESKLLSSALARFDEQPLRLVEQNTHGSPWHELASSNAVKEAMKIVPGFAEQVRDIASKALASIKPNGPSTPVKSTPSGE